MERTNGAFGSKREKCTVSIRIVGSKKEKTVGENAQINEKNQKYDIMVIGGGPAGYVAAIRAAQLGAAVALAEKDVLGGTCLNRGCVPTKHYLKNAKRLEEARSLRKHGILLGDERVTPDMEAFIRSKNEVVNTLTTGVEGLLLSNGVKIYRGDAYVHSDRSVNVGEQKIFADKIILATGSKAVRPPIVGAESRRVLTSDEILDLKTIPKKLTIVGGGVIGLEMATIFHAYGTEITIVEAMDNILGFFDKELVVQMEELLVQKKIKILTSAKIERFEERGDGIMTHLTDRSIESDLVLLSVGRKADTEAVEALDLKMSRGYIQVDDFMRTDVEWLYAAGDVNGRKMLAHAAMRMGEIAAENAFLGTKKKISAAIPSCVYTHPELASIGKGQEELRAEDISVGRFSYSHNGRALAAGELHGFAKIIIDKKYGEILGAHILGENATELINELSIIMQNELTAHEVMETVFAHPSYSETIMEACADALGRSIHLPKKDKENIW